MHSALEPERNEEDEPRGGSKRKFSELDGDQAPESSSSSPMMIDSDGWVSFIFISLYLILGLPSGLDFRLKLLFFSYGLQQL